MVAILTTLVDAVVTTLPRHGRPAAASRAELLETRSPGAGFGLAVGDGMLRTIAFTLLCVSVAAAPAAAKKTKKHKPAHAAKLKLKQPKALALRSPTRVAGEMHAAAPTVVATPTPAPT